MNATTGLNLLISDKPDVERDALADSFERRGGCVHRLGRFWAPPVFDPATVRVYGADSFCLVLQQKFGFELCSPDDELLLHVPAEMLRRELRRSTLAEAGELQFPTFIKPVVPKQFRGAVYPNASALADECRGLPSNALIFVSEPVNLVAEAHSFVLEGRVLDTAIYEGRADAAEATTLVAQLARAVPLPRALVIDTGLIANRGWALVEFNAAWGAGLNGCDPERVLPAIMAASGPQSPKV